MIVSKKKSQVLQVCNGADKFHPKSHKGPLGQSLESFGKDLKFFNKKSSELNCLSFVNLFSCENKIRTKVYKRLLGKPLEVFLCLILRLLVTFSCL